MRHLGHLTRRQTEVAGAAVARPVAPPGNGRRVRMHSAHKTALPIAFHTTYESLSTLAIPPGTPTTTSTGYQRGFF